MLLQEIMVKDNVLPPDANVEWWSTQLSVSVRQLFSKFREVKRDPLAKTQVPNNMHASAWFLTSDT